MKPDDKPKKTDSSYEEPKLYRVVDGKKIMLPALETAFVDFSYVDDNSGEIQENCTCNSVGSTVCSCNKVKVACSCVGYSSCSCVGYSACSCVSHNSCSCVGHTTCSCNRVTTGCRCAPVH